MTKIIGLYSGGLDSILSIKVVSDAMRGRVEIIPVRFTTPFFDYKDESNQKKEAAYLKEKFNINLCVIDITDDFLRILDCPKYGYGKNLNPCIDCKILMFKKAKEIMEKERAKFVFTGEVSGQRPKSQKIDKLRLIERESGLEGKLLRPLSAKLLTETIFEKEGIIDRKKLLGINGRSRTEQLRLAEKYNIKYFATPAGGCLLTDQEYARKLNILKDSISPLSSHFLNFLRWGRALLIKNKLLIIGRNDFENKKLLKLASPNDLLVQPKEIPGPIGLFLSEPKVSGYLKSGKNLKLISGICAKYSLKNKNGNDDTNVKIQYGTKDKGMEEIDDLKELTLTGSIDVKPVSNDVINNYKV